MKQIALLSSHADTAGGLRDYTLRRLSKILTEHPSFSCTVVSCDDLCLEANEVAIKHGAILSGDVLVPTSFDRPIRPDYVYFHSLTDIPNRHAQCLKLLTELAERGVPVNYDADSSMMGIKSVLEYRCNEFHRESGLAIPRPRTLIFRKNEDRSKIVDFIRAGAPCILKPHNSSRARGIRVLVSEEQVPRLILTDDIYILQELLANPMTMNEHKVSLRVYLTIRDLRRPTYAVLEQGLLKCAVQPYMRGNPQAEIVGTSYAKRIGFTPVIHLFRDLNGSEAWLVPAWREIRSSIEKTLDLFMEAVSWRAGMFYKTLPSFLFWGVDIAIQCSKDGPKAYLIEVNTFPALYRNDAVTDNAMDGEVIEELFAKAGVPSPWQ
jgi:glutathione synthase/RimK-type ligase-like ATP-grasp enzyme